MPFSQKWEEIYATSDQEAFFRAKYLLNEQGISFKTELTNNQLRLSFNNVDGSRAALGRDGSVRAFYKILVKKEDREKAGLILEKQTEDILTALRKGGSHGMSR